MPQPLDGECIKDDFLFIADNPFPEVIAPDLPDRTHDCCSYFKLKALASIADADPLKNDRKGFIWWFDPVITTVVMELEKADNSGTYSTLATLNTGTYGTFYAYGFFTNGFGEKFIGYQLEWRNVLTAHGPGMYRVKVNLTAAIGSPALTGFFYSYEYCLEHYTGETANGTVRIEYYISGRLGRMDTDKKQKDFGTLDWYDQIRLSGWFGFPKATYETEYTTRTDGSRKYVEDNQEPEYVMTLFNLPAFVHNLMRVDVMMADTVAVTDYNAENAETFVQKYVQKASEYSPNWHELQSKLASVNLKWRQEYNNYRKLRF